MTREEISKLTDIYPPFLMIDGVRKIEPGRASSCYLNITGEEWYFKSHIPTRCLMPGTLLIEMMLQTSVLIFYSLRDFGGEKGIIQSVNSRLVKNITPPSIIESFCEIESFRRGIALTKGRLTSRGELLCSGDFKFVFPHLISPPIEAPRSRGVS